jgi:hypothetical protein
MAINPSAIANRAYIQSLYRQKYGRNATDAEIAKFGGRTVRDASNLILGQAASPFGGRSQAIAPTPDAPAGQGFDLNGLITSLMPNVVSEGDLSSRFSRLYDPAYAKEEQDLGDEIALRSSRFNEDANVAAQRRSQQRALTEAQRREQQAAGGASGQLADEQLGRALKPYDEASQDAAVQSSRFGFDTEEERRKRLLGIKQRRATALASFTSNPENKYEYSY